MERSRPKQQPLSILVYTEQGEDIKTPFHVILAFIYMPFASFLQPKNLNAISNIIKKAVIQILIFHPVDNFFNERHLLRRRNKRFQKVNSIIHE